VLGTALEPLNLTVQRMLLLKVMNMKNNTVHLQQNTVIRKRLLQLCYSTESFLPAPITSHCSTTSFSLGINVLFHLISYRINVEFSKSDKFNHHLKSWSVLLDFYQRWVLPESTSICTVYTFSISFVIILCLLCFLVISEGLPKCH